VLLAAQENDHIRVLSADLQQASTLTNADELHVPHSMCLLPDGRLLVGSGGCIRVLEGFPQAVWERRRSLLMCLLAVHAGAEGVPPPPPIASSGVLLRVAALPEELWKGPCIFQYL
jgi:hypothetical protein